MPTPTTGDALTELQDLIFQHWGYNQLRPLQAEAMRAVLDGRDSLVVLPTGGGKSLCYQAPAVYRGGTTVVVSPLIALMKDQVDGLRACGIPAVQLDSSLSAVERSGYEMDLLQGQVRLLFVSPERLVQTDLYRLLQRVGVHTFAIDEAHCISHWGHDFRKEYRMLNRLRDFFPDASVHGYTATATEQVRRDICSQLALRNPAVLVGNFDRGNLTYRILPRQDLMKQVCEIIDRHDGEAGIIYCRTRRDVDTLAEGLRKKGINALPYHAGMSSEDRHATQEAFSAERCHIVVATIAFGMGIDRSNVRYVLHAAMPKSLEHYQQETGRAGRDGLAAECVLLYSGADVMSFKNMLRKQAADENEPLDPEFLTSVLRHLDDMDRYCRGAVCRHKALVQYFGQTLEKPSCNACDLCLGDTEEVPDANTVAQKILSGVARVKGRFGINHNVSILRGENTENIRKYAHDKLSTYGLLEKHSKPDLRDWIYQLIGQGVLIQTEDEYPLLQLNEASWEVMRGQRQVRLIQLVRRKKGERPVKSAADQISWEGVDRDLLRALEKLRSVIAGERGFRASYLVFTDNVLRDLARIRPSTLERMRYISGIGDVKLRDFGDRFLALIKQYCGEHGLSQDVNPAPRSAPLFQPAAVPVVQADKVPATEKAAFDLFRKGAPVDEVVQKTGRARSTVASYLCDYIHSEKPASIRTWVPDELYQRIASTARLIGIDRLKPIYLALGEKVDYDAIRLVVTHILARAETQTTPK